jgi:hypothetical protein
MLPGKIKLIVDDGTVTLMGNHFLATVFLSACMPSQ